MVDVVCPEGSRIRVTVPEAWDRYELQDESDLLAVSNPRAGATGHWQFFLIRHFGTGLSLEDASSKLEELQREQNPDLSRFESGSKSIGDFTLQWVQYNAPSENGHLLCQVFITEVEGAVYEFRFEESDGLPAKLSGSQDAILQSLQLIGPAQSPDEREATEYTLSEFISKNGLKLTLPDSFSLEEDEGNIWRLVAPSTKLSVFTYQTPDAPLREFLEKWAIEEAGTTHRHELAIGFEMPQTPSIKFRVLPSGGASNQDFAALIYGTSDGQGQTRILCLWSHVMGIQGNENFYDRCIQTLNQEAVSRGFDDGEQASEL